MAAVGALSGCDSSEAAGTGPAGGAGQAPAASGSPGTAPTGGTPPAAAGATLTAGQGGSTAGVGGLGGAGGTTQTSAGAGAGGTSGASGTGGTTATAGASGSSNDPQADVAALAALNGFQLLDPCDLTSYQVQSDPGAVCPQKNEIKNQHVNVHLAGDANVTYIVTLRVRGIVERYWYDGGMLDPVSKVFYTDGVPTVGGFASACKNKASDLPFSLPADMTPQDGCFNGFNVFGMSVSAPKHHYFLNYTTDKNDDRPPHAVYKQDYTVDVEMQGQATLDFYVIGSDEHQCYNHDQVIDGVKLSATPYIGEFLQFDVMTVKRK